MPPSIARSASIFFAFTAFASLGCSLQGAGVREYQFVVRINGDPNRPVPGAELSYKGQRMAASDGSGVAKISVNGQEGETVDFSVVCPEGYRSPTSPLSLRLTRLSDSARLPEYQVTCAPSLRDVVIAVRAENGPDLPVRYLGREVARTDAKGAAHFLLRVEPGAQLEVALDTHEKRWLRPQDPVVHFLTRSQDDVFVLDQPFVVSHDPRQAPFRSKRGPVHF